MKGRVLIIAGSDSGGGAGIQADIKAVTALNGYAATAITALTAQNTEGVFGVHPVPCDFIRQQIELVLEDIGADALKTGMLGTADIITTVADTIEQQAASIPLVVDPVMVAKGGHPLLAQEAMDAMIERMIPLARVLTPNIPEAEALTGISISSDIDMIRAGEDLLKKGAKAVLMKGGHGEGEMVKDVLMDGERVYEAESPRIETRHTHGTGCTLASAIACGIAQNMPLPEAVDRARTYVWRAIKSAPGFGKGHGPLNHVHML